MKKINNYSVQYKIIQSHKNNPNPRRFANKNPNKKPNQKKNIKRYARIYK